MLGLFGLSDHFASAPMETSEMVPWDMYAFFLRFTGGQQTPGS